MTVLAVRVFKTKAFSKFATKQNITDAELLFAIERANQGLIDATLGSNIIKQRIAKQSQGKSSGYRTLIFYKLNNNHFFVVGFEKSDKANISASELAGLKLLAKQYESYQPEQLEMLIEKGVLVEIFKNDLSK